MASGQSSRAHSEAYMLLNVAHKANARVATVFDVVGICTHQQLQRLCGVMLTLNLVSRPCHWP